ncbi:vacuolar protein sorting protein 18 [Trypanosoma theileri]|uniref:Vacuolar protein sorting protein 18 n=1 Tax=Trypanosoma theileri TaxID=67003 RepID=A0A1X0NR54_9TRYP|nr:vacuolar protein sorting protein 18 [Trypanosoma theileri]ORC86580.1 vacuolar protein sorting protein 18 [Trypanosoma theileri]
MYVASEALAWFDPALLTTEHLEHGSEDHQGVTNIITAFTHKRFKAQTLSDCALNSNHTHTTFKEFYSGKPKNSKTGAFIQSPEIGCRTERLSCPIDVNKEPFAHVVSAGGTYAVVTECIPQYLYIFDEKNDIVISRLRLSTDKTVSGELQTGEEEEEKEEEVFIDEHDLVSAIYLDPRGNFCIVRWRSGKAVYYYIPRRHHDKYSTDDMMMMMSHLKEERIKEEKTKKRHDIKGLEEEEEKDEHTRDMKPRKFPLYFRPSVIGGKQPFLLECVAWDLHNKSDVTTGDIIFGSSNGGILLICRLEKHGIMASRRLYQFPPPYRNHPIDSIAYTMISHSHDAQQRHVVLIAQKNRLFVFATPWSQRGSDIETAFDPERIRYHDMTPFYYSSSSSSSSYSKKYTTTGNSMVGSLFNYISVHGEVTSPTSCSQGCCHRMCSSTVSHQVDGTGMRTGVDISSLRLFSQVVIVEPHELMPNKKSTPITTNTVGMTETEKECTNKDKIESAPTFGGDELPPVFYWQYGNTLTHGIIMLTDESNVVEMEERYKNPTNINTTTTNNNNTSTTMRNYTNAQYSAIPQTPLRSPLCNEQKSIPLKQNPQRHLLPIGILSVVNLFQCLQSFLVQLQEPGTRHRSSMFSPPPIFSEKNINSHVSQFDGINLTGIERPYSPNYRINTGHEQLRSTGLSMTSTTGTEASGISRDEQGNKEEINMEKFVSFSAGYGHFILTTTQAVYGFCHLAALPFPQKAYEWKNRLVFNQNFRSGKLKNTTISGGSGSDSGDEMMIAFSSHDTGRSQLFHLFTKSNILLLRFRQGRRRCLQYVVQLLDAVCPIPETILKGNASDTTEEGYREKSEDQRSNPSPLTTMVGGIGGTVGVETHPVNSPTYTLWKSPLSFSSEDPFTPSSSRLGWKPLEASTPLSDAPILLLPASLQAQQGYNGNNTMASEELMKLHGSKAAVLPRDGVLSGHLDSGFSHITHYDTDNLYMMALRFAAVSPSLEERRELLPKVRHIYADYLFRQNRFLESAAQHGLAYEGPPYFNTLLVKFSKVAVDDMEPLILLLYLRLCGYEQHRRGVGSHSVEVCCLATWLISLLLERCNQLEKVEEEEKEKKDKSVIVIPTGIPTTTTTTSITSTSTTSGTIISLQNTEENSSLRVRSLKMMAYLRRKYNLRHPQYLMEQILFRYRTFLEWKGIRTAILRIAKLELSIALCSRLGRNEEVLLRLFLQQQRPLEGLVQLEQLTARTVLRGGGGVEISTVTATNTLGNLMESETRCSVSLLKSYWMRYASFLMRLYPCRFVRHGLIPFGAELSLGPMELIPALLLYNAKHNETVLEADAAAEVVLQRHTIEESLLEEERSRASYHAARLYLEHAIYTEGHRSESMLQLLLYFTARDGDDAAISHFFRELCESNETHRLEVSYAYRICSRFQRPIGCAWVSFIMGRHREALQMAILLQNEELAIHFIQSMKGEDVDGIRHELWKELAQTVSNRHGGSRRALQLVAASDGDLNVSDVLPYLCGDVMIREFREELLARVSSFGKTLEGLKQNIQASVKDMELLQSDKEAIQQRPITMPSSQRCIACGQAALTRPFVVFKGCRHVYHKTCFDARRASMEEHLQQQQQEQVQKDQHLDESFISLKSNKKGNDISTPGVEGDLECVLCSTRYLRLLLTNPLSKNLTGSLPRLP